MNPRLTSLEGLKQRLDSYRPLPDAVVKNLHEDLILRWTYHSNAIEGNTLTLKETKVALEGITVGGKSLREHFEVMNHRDAILFVEAFVQKNEAFSEWQIKNIHHLILKNIDDENAGKYRLVNVSIAGAKHLPPDFLHVPQQMQDFINWIHHESHTLHPIECAARIHSDFVKIHPFTDGNGRTSRLLMNLALLKSGYPAVILPVERRLEYYETLDQAHTEGLFGPFLNLIMDIAETGFDPYWHALGVNKP